MFVFIGDYTHINYIDLENNSQTVVYTKKPISCKEKVEISGKVVKVEGTKDPRSKISDDDYCEYHLISDSWKCVEKKKSEKK